MTAADAMLSLFSLTLFLFGLSAGAVLLLLIRAVTWRGWMGPVWPGLAWLARLAPLTGLLFAGSYVLAWPAYPWAEDPALGGYLSPLWTGVRLAVTVAVIALAGPLLAADRLERPGGVPLLIAVVLLVSMASVDWTLSLAPHMKSSTFGLLMLTGWAVQALALVTAAGALAWDRSSRAVWGAVLLVGVALWVYLEFMQYIVMWGANLPAQAEWWISRTTAPWRPFLWVVGLLHFLVPVLCLAHPGVRAKPVALLIASLSILAARAVETVLWTLPSVSADVFLAAAAVLAAVALCLVLVGGLKRREARHG
ncbi:hypothetical protein C882_3534 [Caenispirillum salinarum AK4]|uniref:Uncharacterized protein n=1 Tax=Caenispirillum salinarum AK4 TaxID=1238182 RepID=K9HN81_9PROT|nr:hypothetical protein [Caenispirillum salinarum]EKV31783.1 hypothetical protein C882_3534 [Caenispirillum salinarum AK4]